MISDTYPAYRAIINGTEDVVAQALAKLFRIAIMQRVTDSYGPIPIRRSWPVRPNRWR